MRRVVCAAISILTFLYAGCSTVDYGISTPDIAPYAGTWKPTASFNYGDSITHCVGVASLVNCYVNRLPRYLGFASTTDRATPTYQACDVGKREVFPNDSPAPMRVQPLRTLLIGTNDAWYKRAGPYEVTFNLCHQAVISWLGTTSNNKVEGSSVLGTATGTCATDETFAVANGIACTTPGSTARFSIRTTGNPIYIWYRIIDGDPGVFTYSVDGGAPVTLTTATADPISTSNKETDSVALARVPIDEGSHTVIFSQQTAGTMAIVAVGTANASASNPLPVVVVGDPPSELHDFYASDVAAYQADVGNNVQLFASDGLNVTFAPVGTFLTGQPEYMTDQLHPNDKGHILIFKAFIIGIQSYLSKK